MNSFAGKDARTFVASGVFLFLVLLLMLFLTFIEIPIGNKDLIVSIISMLVGGTGVAMGKLFNDNDSENELLNKRLDDLTTRYDVLKNEYDHIVKMLVERIDIGALTPSPK
jgi:hypothetical protein